MHAGVSCFPLILQGNSRTEPKYLAQKILYFYRCTMGRLQVDYVQWFSLTRTGRRLLSSENKSLSTERNFSAKIQKIQKGKHNASISFLYAVHQAEFHCRCTAWSAGPARHHCPGSIRPDQ